MVIVVALLLLATGGTPHAPTADSRVTAMQSMSFLIGTWQCRLQVVKGPEFEGSMKIAPTLSGSWMEADVQESAVGGKQHRSRTYYWTYDRLTMMWGLYTFDNSGGFGKYGATWWIGQSIHWRGSEFMGHTVQRDVEWTKTSSTRFEIREYFADRSDNVSMVSVEACGKT
jgi:hypothetical protein